TARPTRWVWLAALAASLTLPLVLPGLPEREHLPTIANSEGARLAPPPSLQAVLSAPLPVAPGPPLLERMVVIGWLLASSLLGVAVLLAAVALERRRASWRGRMIGGHPVRISARTGPAVVG